MIENGFGLNWLIVSKLLAATLFALPIAWNREVHTRNMGLRTFPLVSLGACAYVIIGQSFIGADDSDAMARIMQGLLSGIGFVGGGAILKNSDHVRGTASAASIWITGALGASVGFGLWGIAIILSLFNFLTVWLLSRVKKKIHQDEDVE